jgi:hypothetical protein
MDWNMHRNLLLQLVWGYVIFKARLTRLKEKIIVCFDLVIYTLLLTSVWFVHVVNVVNISENESFTVRGKIFQIKKNRGMVPVTLPAIILPINTYLWVQASPRSEMMQSCKFFHS